MRIEFLNTTATRAIGVEGRTIPAHLVPSVAAIAKACRYFEAEPNGLNSAERQVGLIWEALVRDGRQATIHQAAMLADATSLTDEGLKYGGDYRLIPEPGDPKAPAPKSATEAEAEAETDLPTGPAEDDAAGEQIPSA